MATNGIMLHTASINTAQSASDSSNSSSSSSSAGISASDFLTLLVTELKNQDPTSNTDPNEYINQLVGINSLEQLISINETLQSALGESSTSASSQSVSEAGTAQAAQTQSSLHAVKAASQTEAATVAGGNLSLPTATHAADRIASALSGQS